MTALLRITMIAAVLYGPAARAEEGDEPTTNQQRFASIMGTALAAQQHCGLKDAPQRALRFIDYFKSGFSTHNRDDLKLIIYYKIGSEASVKQMGEHAWCMEYVMATKSMFSLGD
jgi:hypothetical protein